MRLWASLLLICACTLSAQTKKILVDREEEDVLLRDLQAVSQKARIVPVNKANVMQEIADADAFIGNISPADERGCGECTVHVRRQRLARQQHRSH
jgi:hypothetical protein